MVGKFEAAPIKTVYWRPREDYLQRIVDSIKNKIEYGNIVTVSEKAISTALGNLVDESAIQPSRMASFIAKYWMRLVWGYFLGSLSRLRKRTIQHLRNYPLDEGGAHKQLALERTGLLEALMFGSEGGIDASNLPYSLVSLPLRNASGIAQKIRRHIKNRLGKEVVVMIVDTDRTYSLRTFHFTHRPRPIRGIRSFGGFLSYVIGRFFKMKHRATPVAVAGSQMQVEEALEVAEIANKARGSGAGRTVWDMAERFGVSVTGVTWEMLEKLTHKPIVIVKPMRREEDSP
ncbi:MAG: coenzyme F420-0:L-glutamate ligase [Candidatus Bathyarchaeia archaeon]